MTGKQIRGKLNWEFRIRRGVRLLRYEYDLRPQAHIVLQPTLQQQKKCENCTETSIDGIFTVQYDVERDSSTGELQVSHAGMNSCVKWISGFGVDPQGSCVTSRSQTDTSFSFSLRPTSPLFGKTLCSSLTSADPCGASK